MTDKQLQESFEYCKSHDDPQAWECLALAYLDAGYPLNAAYCLRQANNYLVVNTIGGFISLRFQE